MGYFSNFIVIKIGIGSTSLIVGFLVKFIPYGKEERYEAIQQTGDKEVYKRLVEADWFDCSLNY